MYNLETAVTAVNLLVCIGIFWACICRLNSNISKLYLRVRARYTLLLAGALVSGFQPIFFGDRPTIAGLVFAICILAGLVLNIGSWRMYRGTERRCENQ